MSSRFGEGWEFPESSSTCRMRNWFSLSLDVCAFWPNNLENEIFGILTAKQPEKGNFFTQYFKHETTLGSVKSTKV
jgi:hypothetical protein